MLKGNLMSKCRMPDTSRAGKRWLPLAFLSRWLVGAVILTARLAFAQEALQNSLAGDAAAQARNLQQQSQAYTIKSGDFRLLATPSLSLDWNDNINLSKSDPL